ncbi:histidine--tRNA ligase [Gandjariella thermophila]|uniref:Histidine--tRNA ligase n=1 Tax=Gandjariella thermophila TaxID=1931992 RepID=A0A4D4JH51_9PSEU|nr:histidine--tRNA ligase [Gandjariella thermophila]GDY33233.1 histidine--tRNA ligase [Gandjariella thermophila]
MAQAAEPASGTRDFLADDVRRRERAFTTVREVFERYGFDPLVTPAFERLDVLTGKYGDEGDKLIFKILRRGEHEASGEADLALRYDLTVPLARVVATYGNRLPTPYKRYALGSVWRADRPGRGRFREFTQCDVDTVGSTSPLADAEILWAIHDALEALGIEQFRFEINSRQALFGLLDAYGVPADLGGRVLITLDKLDKLDPDAVSAELVERGLATATASALVADLASDDPDRVRKQLDGTEQGRAGLAEVDRLVELTAGLPAGRVAFTPRMVRGLDYYTGPIFEVSATGYPGSIASGGRYDGLVAALGGPDVPACGGSIGIERILASQQPSETEARGLDVAITVLGAEADLTALAAALRSAGLRVGVYLGSSGKLAKQLKWANDQRARFAVLYGRDEQADGAVTIRDMHSGDQERIAFTQAAAYLAARVRGD